MGAERPHDTSPDSAPSLALRRLTPEDCPDDIITQLAALHAETFPDGVLSQLGTAFVERYYRGILHAPAAFLWVVLDGDTVAGWMAGTTDRERFEREHRAGAAKSELIRRVLTLRMSPLAVVRGLRKQRLARNVHDRAELLVLALRPAYRRSGQGRRLMQVMAEEVRAAGERQYIVFTDNEEGYQFYCRIGGECLFHFRMGGRTSACFRIRLDEPDSPAARA